MPHLHPLVCSLFAASAFFAASAPVLAASNICDFQAYSDDSDPNGTNVRGGPGTSFPVVGVLMPVEDDDGYVWSPEFAVTKFENGWFQIGGAIGGRYGDGPVVQVFKGPGWVSAKLVEFALEDPKLRSAPSSDAPVTLEMAYDAPWHLDSLRIQTVHACEGSFLDVTLINEAGATKRGWVTHLCANQATTCSYGSVSEDAEAQ